MAMKSTLICKISAAVLMYATLVGAVSAQNTIIICGGGVYCTQVRQECLAAGGKEWFCEAQWRRCVIDACPQR